MRNYFFFHKKYSRVNCSDYLLKYFWVFKIFFSKEIESHCFYLSGNALLNVNSSFTAHEKKKKQKYRPNIFWTSFFKRICLMHRQLSLCGFKNVYFFSRIQWNSRSHNMKISAPNNEIWSERRKGRRSKKKISRTVKIVYQVNCRSILPGNQANQKNIFFLLWIDTLWVFL